MALAALCLMTAQMACVHGKPVAAVPGQAPRMAVQSDFEDLQPGQVRVVVPMLKSGGYMLPSLTTQTSGTTLELQAGDDFLGYERAYYTVSRRTDGGIRILFTHAEVWEHGKTHKSKQPLLDLFAEAAGARHVRLVYLIRESRTDHNMAIVASDDPVALDALTHAVVQQAECRSTANASCRWVPNGVAVTPEPASAARPRTENRERRSQS